jgi:hypothetical protein
VVATVVSDNRYTPSRVVERPLTDWMSVENRPLLHGTAGNSTTPLQQAQSHPQQILASSQDNKNDVLNQKSRTPEPAMFGLPGTGHSKPAILSPGLSLLLLVHCPIPSCFNSCLNTNNSVFS